MTDPDVLARTADLARLSIGAGEAAQMARDFARILSYVSQIESVDISGIPPLSHGGSPSPALRDDQARPGLSRDAALQNAPAQADGFFTVPKVISGPA